MVRNDRANMRWGWIFFSFCAIVTGSMLLPRFQQYSLYASPLITAGYLASVIIIAGDILLAITLFVQMHRWKRVNYRRQMVAYWGFAARIPLANPQLLPNTMALPLPFTITLKPTWTLYLISYSQLVGGLLLMYAFANFSSSYGESPIMLPFVVAIFLIPLTLRQCSPQQIEITAEGLTIRNPIPMDNGWPFSARGIRWHDARLFAIRDSKPDTPGTRYELSGSFTVVEWTRLRRPRWWSFYRPAIPFAEYDAQMDALIALITGITGLPLYDVR